jgi:hypothetical protein
MCRLDRNGYESAENSQTRRVQEMLHTSFKKIDDTIRGMISKGMSDTAIRCKLRNEWKTLFQQNLSDTAVQGLLIHYRSLSKGKGQGKGQKGGMAPLDYTLGQGTTAHTYGNFPTDITTNQRFIHDLDATRNYDSSIGKACQKGGTVMDALVQGHIPTSVPSLGDTVTAFTPVSSIANLHAFNSKPYNPSNFVSVSHASSVYSPM